MGCGSSAPTGKAHQAPKADQSQSPTQYKYDCFLSHDWGKDEYGANNHERVAKLNKCLNAKGIRTWFDEDKLNGNIINQMCEGIDTSKIVVVCITERYVKKVAGDDENDNCKREFLYAMQQKTATRMVPVVMENKCIGRAWKGPVGMTLSAQLYKDLCADRSGRDKGFQAKAEDVANFIKEKLHELGAPTLGRAITQDIVEASSQGPGGDGEPSADRPEDVSVDALADDLKEWTQGIPDISSQAKTQILQMFAEEEVFSLRIVASVGLESIRQFAAFGRLKRATCVVLETAIDDLVKKKVVAEQEEKPASTTSNNTQLVNFLLDALQEQQEGLARGSNSSKLPTETLEPSRGWRFHDHVKSIDCDSSDKAAKANKQARQATVVTKEVFNGSKDSLAFMLRVENAGQDKPFSWGIVDDETHGKHKVYVIGHKDFSNCIGMRCTAKEGHVVGTGSQRSGFPGVSAGDTVGVSIREGRGAFLKNGTVLHEFRIKGTFRFGVSLIEEGQGCTILDETQPHKAHAIGTKAAEGAKAEGVEGDELQELIHRLAAAVAGGKKDMPNETFEASRGWRFHNDLKSVDCDVQNKNAKCVVTRHSTSVTKEVWQAAGTHVFFVKILQVKQHPFTWGVVNEDTKGNHTNYPIGHASYKGTIGAMCTTNGGRIVHEGSCEQSTPGVSVGDIVGVRVNEGRASFVKNGRTFHNIGLKGSYRFAVSLLEEGQECEIIDGDQPDKSVRLPQAGFDATRGWRFVDHLKSIDCDSKDKTAKCVHEITGTVVTQEVVDSAGTYEFNVKVLHVVENAIFTWGFCASETYGKHSNYPLGHKKFPDSMGAASTDSTGKVMSDGKQYHEAPGVAAGDIVGVHVKDGQLRFTKNGESFYKVGVKGNLRFGVSLHKPDQRCQIVDSEAVNQAAGGEPEELPKQSYDDARGWRFCRDVKRIIFDVDAKDKSAKSVTERQATLLTQEVCNAAGSFTFSVRLIELKSSPFVWGVVDDDAKGVHANHPIGHIRYKGTIGAACTAEGGCMMQDGNATASAVAISAGDVLGVEVEKGTARFVKDGVSFHEVGLTGTFRFGISFLEEGQECEIVDGYVPKSKSAEPLVVKMDSSKNAAFLGSTLLNSAVRTVPWESLNIRMDKPIGEGAFGATYPGKLAGLPVAVKVLKAEVVSDELLLAFKKEVKVLAAVTHPNLLQMIAVVPDRLGIVTEMQSHGDLDKFLERERQNLQQALRFSVVRDVAQGMAWLAYCGFIHRDLKLQNILIGQGHQARVGDFGLCSLATDVQDSCGTIAYMAPETLEVDGKPTEKSDVYAYSIVLLATFSNTDVDFQAVVDGMQGTQGTLKMLKRLLDEGAVAPFIEAVKAGKRPAVPSEVPDKIKELVLKCWAHDAAERPAFAGVVDMIIDLSPSS